jgi:hypothetical protein
MSFASLDIQRLELAVVVLQSCNTSKTYIYFIFSTKFHKTSFEKLYMMGIVIKDIDAYTTFSTEHL